MDSTDEWDVMNVLSLDGGGIRGFWTLLVLDRLMGHIGDAEKDFLSSAGESTDETATGSTNDTTDEIVNEPAKRGAAATTDESAGRNSNGDFDRLNSRAEITDLHSFLPFDRPANVSWAEDLRSKKARNGLNEDRKSIGSEESDRFLPCHYFDLICGSSTGGLIAIMLSRFRMTVSDCLKEYALLGDRIFGSPRPLHYMNTFIVRLEKFSARNAEKVFKDVAKRRCNGSTDHTKPIRMNMESGLCKLFVTCMSRTPHATDYKASVAKPFIIRSYYHGKPTKESGAPLITNFDEAEREKENMEVWQVARAATAATFFFKPFRDRPSFGKKGRRKAMRELTDGGFGPSNNPTYMALEEMILYLGGDDAKLGTIVSIGTASDSLLRTDGRMTTSKLREMAQSLTNPEHSHAQAKARMENKQRGKDYYRFNATEDEGPPGVLKVEMDEWKPRHMFRKEGNGEDTLEKMRNHFAAWMLAKKNGHDAKLKKCAEALVRRRHARTHDHWRWERFALGSSYRCVLSNCDKEFQSLDELWDHLEGGTETHQKEIKPFGGDRQKFRDSEKVKRRRREWKYRGPEAD